jgi:hypothetical protein
MLPAQAEPALPVLLDRAGLAEFQTITTQERAFLSRAGDLFRDGYYDHALLDTWNAAVCNLRRRAEAYGVELFQSVVKDEPGRKKYDENGETLAERWSGVDDVVLVSGCARLGLLNKKAGKTLEMINWMRNHTTPAHPADETVGRDDVVGLVLLLQRNLFETPLPDAGHSIVGLFAPVKSGILDDNGLDLLKAQIVGLPPSDVRTAFGFMLDATLSGERPAFDNVARLFADVWARAGEDLRRTAGIKYHALQFDHSATNVAAKDRLLDLLTSAGGIKYIPDAARATIYRRAAKLLAKAKDTSYGFNEEVKAAKSLAQFGPYVPAIAFDEVYQEILAVWCGNYWRRSSAYSHLEPFIDSLDRRELRKVVELFQTSARVRAELFQHRPKAQAIALLTSIKDRFTLEAHKNEVDLAIESLDA